MSFSELKARSKYGYELASITSYPTSALEIIVYKKERPENIEN